MRLNIAFILMASALLVYGCSDPNAQNGPSEQPSPSNLKGSSDLPIWMTAELKDVKTDKTFSISDFEGKPVLVELFAVWCPLCTRQQQESKRLEEEFETNIVSIAIDVDPNEDKSKIQEHIARHGFNWHYAIAPSDFTESLIEEFELGITNVPNTPMVLICSNGSIHRLRSGVKSAEELKRSVEENCA